MTVSQRAESAPETPEQVGCESGRGAEGLRRRQERSCGSCRACCIAPRVIELDKPIDSPCPFLKRATDDPAHEDSGACSIYNHRPSVCRGFLCGWRLGLGEEQDRPDRLGLLIQPARDADGREILAFVEMRRGAMDSNRSRRLLAWWSAATDGHVTVRPAGHEHFARVKLTVERVVVTDAARRLVGPSVAEPVAEPPCSAAA